MQSQQPSQSLCDAGLAVTGLLGSLESGDKLSSPLEMPLQGGFCSFLCGRKDEREKGQRETSLTHTPGGEADTTKFCAGLSLETQMLEGRQPLASVISCDRNLGATWLELRRDLLVLCH